MGDVAGALCCLCGCNDFSLISDRLRDGSTTRQVHQCTGCRHVQLLPRPTVEEDKAFYDTNSQDRAIRLRIDVGWERRTFEMDTRRRADFVQSLARPASTILDVGAGYGFFLAEMDRRGFKVEGIEVSEERRKLANKVTTASLYPINLAAEKGDEVQPSDTVTLFHVLEHVDDPIEFAAKLRDLVKPGGCLVCEVPNVDELLIEVCPEYREFYWIRAHLNYFSVATLERVLSEAGFGNVEVRHVQRYGVENLCNWLRTGQPQLNAPRFQIDPAYRWLEDAYRNRLSDVGQSDTLIAIAYL